MLKGIQGIIKHTGICEDEQVLILTDLLVDRRIVEAIAREVKERGARVEINDKLPLKFMDDLPVPLGQMIYAAKMVIFLGHQSWYHTPTRRLAKYKFKCRIVEFYNPNEKVLKGFSMTVDTGLMRQFGAYIGECLEKEDLVRITTPAGTLITVQYSKVGYEWGDYRAPGSGGNLPAGEVFALVEPDLTEGSLVFDANFEPFGLSDKQNLRLAISKGMIYSMSGYNMDEFPLNVAELGIGINPKAVVGNHILEDEKVCGLVHIGFGNNSYFGGDIQGPHYDGVMLKPTITIGETVLLKDGYFPEELFIATDANLKDYYSNFIRFS